MKNILTILACFLTLQINGQNIIFSFAGKNAGTQMPMTVNRVHIFNETNGSDTIVDGNTFTVLITSINIAGINKYIDVYPNPFHKEVAINFNSGYSEKVSLAVYTIDGKKIAGWAGNIGIGESKFMYKSGIEGLLILTINSGNIQLRTKLICMEKSNSSGFTILTTSPNSFKSAQNIKSGFIFRLGDQLKFIGYSGLIESGEIYDTPTGNSSYTLMFDVSGYTPVADFIAPITNINQGGSVSFSDQSTNTPTSWKWDFGDNGTSSIQNPVHQYNEAGLYSVRLIARNNFGSDTITKPDYIEVLAEPVLSITPANLDFDTISTLKTFEIKNRGTGALTWAVSESISWLTVSPRTGITTNETDNVIVTANRAGLLHGNYSGLITVTSNGGNQDINISIDVTVLLPTVTTNPVTNITQTTATGGGNVTSDGGATVTARGVCWNTTGGPTIADNKTTNDTGTGPFTSNLTGLTANTKYYVRAYATNSVGTNYGDQVPFTTAGVTIIPPTVGTNPVTNITQTTATCGGNVTSDGGAPVTARGVCWSTTGNPTIADSKTSDGTGAGEFTSNLTGLTLGTKYYVRAYATNSAGTDYGPTTTFTADFPNCGTITDIDGNTYKTVMIGSQCWMRENLKTTKFRGGTLISNVTDGTTWSNLTRPAYCWYNNDINNKNTYGALYNWHATTVNGGVLCPTGWHVPSDAEWTTLTTFLGGETVAGGEMKESGTTHWTTPNTGATNESGFTGLPGGDRLTNGDFDGITSYGLWWSSAEYDSSNAWSRYLLFNSSDVYRNYFTKELGFSVRCVKDN